VLGVVEWHQEAVMELSVDVCVLLRVEEEEKPGLRGWLQKWWGAQGSPATTWHLPNLLTGCSFFPTGTSPSLLPSPFCMRESLAVS
jgi:hypothetical protein